MRVLIAGCGYVGVALGLELHAAGHQVWGLRRSSESLPEGILGFSADLTEPDTLSKLPEALDIVVYMASPSERSDAGYQAAYIEGLGCVVDALVSQRQSLRRLFLVTSTAVYAQQHGEWVDEASPAEPTHFSGKRLLEAERLAQSSPFPATVMRLSGIYGPGRDRLIRNVKAGGSVASSGARFSNRIHRDDCAGALHHLMVCLAEDAPGDVYVGVDHAPVPLSEVYGWIASELGVAPLVFTAPLAVSTARGGASNKRCRNTRLVESGYVFRYPTYREGYGELL